MTRRALCVGIDTYGGGLDLAGCVNDTRDWSLALAARGYAVTQLLNREATRAAILGHLDALIRATGPRDRLVVCYSGHGTYVPDATSDETDSTDEAWVPADYQRGLILDDDRQRRGGRHLIISDSCHSGTMSRGPMLPWRWDLAGVGADQAVTRFMPPAEIVPAGAARSAATRNLPSVPVPLLAACAPHEVAWETNVAGRRGGVFTRAAIATIDIATSLRGWHRAIQARVTGQTPQLDASRWQRLWMPL